MAKKKQSAYTKQRNRLLAKIRYWNKQGYEVHITVPLTERQLRQEGIKGKDLTKQTNILKNQNKNFDRITMTSKVDPSLDYRSRKEARQFEPSSEQLAYERYVEFIAKLTRPIPSYGKKEEVIQASQDATRMMYYYATNMANDMSPTEVGRALIVAFPSGDELWTLIDVIMYYASTQEQVWAKFDEIMNALSKALSGQSLSAKELGDLQEESEMYVDMEDFW